MRFKKFLEAADIDDSNIVIRDDQTDYWFNFENERYKVTFYLVSGDFGLTKGAIYFEGPNDYGPTGLSGYKATKLYGIMLSVIKAFIKKHNPQTLFFSGSIGSMDLVYNKFAKKYIGDKPGRPSNEIFIQYDRKSWIRKDVYEKLGPENKQLIDAKIGRWGDEKEEYFGRIRQQGMERRNNSIKFSNYIGGFALSTLFRPEWYIIYKVSEDGQLMGIRNSYDRLEPFTVYEPDTLKFFALRDIQEVPKNVISNFAQKIANSSYIQALIPKETLEAIMLVGNQ